MLMVAVVLLAVAVSDVAAGPGECACAIDVTTCAKFKAYLDCLETDDQKPCNIDSSTATAINEATVCDTEAGHTDSACKCQEDFWSSERKDDTRCKGYDTLMGCMAGKTGNDCSGCGTKQAFATTVKALREATASNCPTITATCTCQHTAAIADARTDANICTLVAAELTCLKDIAATDVSCTTGILQPAVTTTVTAWQTNKTCIEEDNSGAAENVFTATSLVLALLSTFIL